MINPDFLIVPYQLVVDSNLTPLDRLVYSVIYWFERLKEGKCKATNSTIAEILKVQDAGSVANSISKLHKLGYITVKIDPITNQRKSIKTHIAFAKAKPKTTKPVKIENTKDAQPEQPEKKEKTLKQKEYLSGIWSITQDIVNFWNKYSTKPQDMTSGGNLPIGVKRTVEAFIKRFNQNVLAIKMNMALYFVMIELGEEKPLTLPLYIRWNKYNDWQVNLSDEEWKEITKCYNYFKRQEKAYSEKYPGYPSLTFRSVAEEILKRDWSPALRKMHKQLEKIIKNYGWDVVLRLVKIKQELDTEEQLNSEQKQQQKQ